MAGVLEFTLGLQVSKFLEGKMLPGVAALSDK